MENKEVIEKLEGILDHAENKKDEYAEQNYTAYPYAYGILTESIRGLIIELEIMK